MSHYLISPRDRPLPRLLLLPAAVAVVGVLAPLSYLVIRAFQADRQTLSEVIFRRRNFDLLLNTLGLTGAVLAAVVLLALPVAWLTTRTDLPGRRWFALLAVMPLAVPGYLMAYTLLALGGAEGVAAKVLGYPLPRISGFAGATIALTFYNLPYMFLNLRVAMTRLNPALEESARSLGESSMGVFFRVTLPQLWPAICAGGLLVALHVIGDFGVVSLMRYPSFSFALYQQYQLGDRVYAAWLVLMLIAMAGGLLLLELRFLRALRLDPAGMLTRRAAVPVRLGWAVLPAVLFLSGLALVGIVAPLGTILYWMSQAAAYNTGEWKSASVNSLTASLAAALLATGLAATIAYPARRHPSVWTRAVEKSAYLGYATPPLAFALALVFFSLRVAPGVYQTLGLLIYAYGIHFLAEAIGPMRTALYVATPRLEEVSRSLGHGRLSTFFRVTLPLLRPGLVASMALVFLSVMKELPLAIILSPPGFDTLAKSVWSYTNEAMFPEAAPYALTILLVSAGFVGLLLTRGHEGTE